MKSDLMKTGYIFNNSFSVEISFREDWARRNVKIGIPNQVVSYIRSVIGDKPRYSIVVNLPKPIYMVDSGVFVQFYRRRSLSSLHVYS